jgi:probable rRNA maturation factor
MADSGPSSTGHAARLEVEIVRQAEVWQRIPISDAELERAATAAFLAARPAEQGPYEATLVLSDDSEMRTLNRTWRGKDASTNVLSFPSGLPAGETQGESYPLGDVVLAGETVLREAGQQGIPVADHVAHLVVHGMLHLLGHDHERDDDAERMEALETKVLAGLGIADPYAEAPLADVAEVSP